MSEEQISDLKETLARVETRMDERSRQSEKLQNWVMTLFAAVILQAVVALYYAGSKSERLDRVVSDVSEIKSKINQITSQ